MSHNPYDLSLRDKPTGLDDWLTTEPTDRYEQDDADVQRMAEERRQDEAKIRAGTWRAAAELLREHIKEDLGHIDDWLIADHFRRFVDEFERRAQEEGR